MAEERVSAAVLNARYVAIRTAEAKGLTGRLLAASRDRTPGVRKLIAPTLYRFWYRNRAQGWELLEQIAGGAIRFPGLLDREALQIFGELSMPIMNACRREPDELARLAEIWQVPMAALFGSPLAKVGRVLARHWVLKAGANALADVMKRQPAYQPVNFKEFAVTFARPDAFRLAWRTALECLERPETGPGAIERILSRSDLPFDLYLMLICERALIYQGAREPASALDLAERLFRDGCMWFRQSILYILFHVLSSQPAVEDGWLDRYDALCEEFFTSGSWRLETAAATYNFASQLASPDVVAALHRPGRAPRVIPALLERAIAAGDSEQIAGLFSAIDGVAFYHNSGALALTLIERAYERGGRNVEERVLASLASVRLHDQPLVDTFLEQHRIFSGFSPAYVAAVEPSVGEEDLVTLIDGFVIHMLLTSDYFRGQICAAFRRALGARSVQEFLVQLLEWVRDELRTLPRPASTGLTP